MTALLADYRFVCNNCTPAPPSVGHLLQALAKTGGEVCQLSLQMTRDKKTMCHSVLSNYAYFYNRDFSQRQLILMSCRYLSLYAVNAQL